MIKRFVKMTFQSDSVERFKDIFNSSKSLIAAMDGCQHVELLQDISNPCIFFTLSIWDGPDYLEAYRKSALFEGVWAKTKILFDDKPQAWSLQGI